MRIVRIFLAAVLALPFLIAAPHPVRSQTLAHLRVMSAPLENGAQVYYAKEMGMFAKAGLDVDIQIIQSGSATTAAIAANAADIGFSSLVPLAIAHTKNVPFVLIAAGAEWTQAARNSALYVPVASPIRTGKDLNGKTLTTAGLGTLTEYATRAWVDQNGGDLATIKFAEMAYSTMTGALAAGRVDAALVNEPWLEVARKNARLIGYPYDAVAKDFLIGGWFTTAQWARDNADLAARFAAVMREAARWANDKRNQARSGEILAKYTSMDPATISTMTRVHFGEQLLPALVQPQIDVAAKYVPFATFPAMEIIDARAR
jgi:NitT/TauT family transport system substrate-binding protein